MSLRDKWTGLFKDIKEGETGVPKFGRTKGYDSSLGSVRLHSGRGQNRYKVIDELLQFLHDGGIIKSASTSARRCAR